MISAILAGLSGIVAGVTAIATAVAPVIQGLAVIGLAVEGLKAIGNAVIGVGKALGIIPEKTNVEELGDKALQMEEDGIKPENYDSYEKFIDAVEKYEIDPEKSKKYTSEQKILKGTEIGTGVVVEKSPDSGLLNLLSLIGEKLIPSTTDGDIKVIEKLVQLAADAPDKLNNVCDVIKNVDTSIDAMISAKDTLESIGKKLNIGNVSDILR